MFFGLQEEILNWFVLRKWKFTYESQTVNQELFLHGRVGRMPLSSQMSEMIRYKLDEVVEGRETDEEMKFLKPLFELQKDRSHLPGKNEFLD